MIGWMISVLKWTVFAAMVLVLGHVVEWRERTISDHIKSTLSHFESSPPMASIPSVKRRVTQAIQGAEKFSKEERARLDKLLSGPSQR